MHGESLWWVLPGFLGVLYTMLVWWRDVIHEGQEGDHTPVVQLGLRYGMILFIASEVMFFVAWFWAFFNSALNLDAGVEIVKDAFTGGVWPPKGIEVFDPWHLPLLNTLILLTSGTTVTWAHHALIHNDRKGLIWGLVCTIVLGMIFTARPGLRVRPRGVLLRRQHLRFDLLHGDRLPRLPCHRRHDIPDRLPDPCGERPFHAAGPFRLRGGGLVLAFRRRGVDLPLLLHLCLGRLGRGDPRVTMATAGDKALYPDLPPTQTGLRGRCPRCGEGRLFKGFLGLEERCQACGLDYDFSDSGDGPAVFIIMIVGFIVVGLALFVEFSLRTAVLGAHPPLGAARAHPRHRPSPAVEGTDDRPAIQAPGGRGADRRGVSAPPPGQGTPDTDGEKAGGWQRLIVPAILAGIAFVILVGLGIWQLERLAWKEALIARVEAGLAADPVAAPGPEAWPAVDLSEVEYQPLEAAGVFDHSKEIHVVYTLTGPKGPLGGLGYQVFTPLRTDGGWWVYVNRGFVPRENKDPTTRSTGQIEGETTHGWAPSRAGQRDPGSRRATMSPETNGSRATRNCTPRRRDCRRTTVAPYLIDARFDPELPGGLPQGGETIVSFPNNHLQYAVTWFGLAAVLVAVFAAFTLRRLREDAA